MQFKSLILSTTALLIFTTKISCQLTIDTTINKEKLVEMLVDNSVYFDSVKLSCNEKAFGVFDHPLDETNLGLSSGIILTTGYAFNAIGPNNHNSKSTTGYGYGKDADLSTLASGASIRDKCVLEFDIVPIGDVVKFSYVFGSEEYPEYACSQYNDVFGFFVSGPGINGTFENNAINIAKIDEAGEYAVAINTINSGELSASRDSFYCIASRGSLNFSHLYTDNSKRDSGDSTRIQYDGFTKKLQAQVKVIPCRRYHFKLAISDVGDGGLDSGVFIEKNSFTSSTTLVKENIVYPTCENNCSGKITLEPIEENGANYSVLWMKDGVEVAKDTMVLDGICEGAQVNVLIETENQECRQMLNLEIPKDLLEITVDRKALSAAGACDGAIELAVNGGVPPYTFNWNDGTRGPAQSDLCKGIYSVTVTDFNGCKAIQSIKILEAKPTVDAPVVPLPKPEETIKPKTEDGLSTFLNTSNLVLFGKNSSRISSESMEYLKRLAQLLIENPAMKIMIIGHASAEGTADSNMAISVRRANRVKEQLLRNGVKDNQLLTDAKGEQELKFAENSEAERAKNRRVEIMLPEN